MTPTRPYSGGEGGMEEWISKGEEEEEVSKGEKVGIGKKLKRRKDM